jgi:hypothetical protein
MAAINTSDKVELALILAVSLLIAVTDLPGPERISVGYVLLFCSGAMLVLSLIRDISILVSSRHKTFDGPPRESRCMCVESAVGLGGVMIAAMLLGAGFTEPVCMYGGGWAIFLLPSLLTGFLLKDYVFEWNPWRIRREKNHLNIIFRWRK